MDTAALNRATLARQGLLRRRRTPVGRALTDLVGLNAQAPDLPYLSLHARLDEFGVDRLVRLLRRRRAVRATFFRGTIHLVSATDFLTWRAALQPVLDRIVRSEDREGVLALVDLPAILARAREWLAAEPRTRAELARLLAPYARPSDRPGSILAFAVRMMLPLVQVPPAGEWGDRRIPAYQLAANWLGTPPAPVEGAREELVRRYLAAFGPATVKDAQYWSGLTRLREVFAAIRPRLVIAQDDQGRELYDVPRAPLPAPGVAAPPRLLPAWDNVLFGHDDRSRVLPADRALRERLVRGAAAFLVDGRVAGTWSIERANSRARLLLSPLAAVPRSQQAPLRAEAGRTLAFVAPDAAGRTVELEPAD